MIAWSKVFSVEQITEIKSEIFIYAIQGTQFLIAKPWGQDTKFPFRECRFIQLQQVNVEVKLNLPNQVNDII